MADTFTWNRLNDAQTNDLSGRVPSKNQGGKLILGVNSVAKQNLYAFPINLEVKVVGARNVNRRGDNGTEKQGANGRSALT